MTSLYPSSILSITNPTPGNTLNSPSHSNQHATENDNIVAIETKLGVDNSSVVSSVDWKIGPNGTGGGHIQPANQGGTGQTIFNKGDILAASSSSVLGKQGAGADGSAIIYDSTQTNGLNSAVVLTAPTIQNQTPVFGIGSVISASVYGMQITPIPSVLTVGQAFEIMWPNTNASSILALSISSLVAKRLVLPDGTNPEVGSLQASMISRIEYDSTNFQITSYSHNVGTTAKKLVQLDGSAKLPALDASQLTNIPNTSSWIKVSTITFTSVSVPTATVTTLADFTSLAGDTDDIYYLVWEITSAGASSSTRGLGIRYNADTGNNYIGNQATLGSTYSGNNTTVQSYSPLTNTTVTAGSFGYLMIYAKNVGNNRGATFSTQTGNNGQEIGQATWVNAANQVTEITITIIQASGSTQTYSGIATLYKIVR